MQSRHPQVLLKYGLSESVLSEFATMLEEFAAAIALGNEGRAAHVGATREIFAVAAEIVHTVRVMDGRNRQRFAEDSRLMGSWISASKIIATPTRPDTELEGGTPDGGEVRPAA
jgi:hypothetical protein